MPKEYPQDPRESDDSADGEGDTELNLGAHSDRRKLWGEERMYGWDSGRRGEGSLLVSSGLHATHTFIRFCRYFSFLRVFGHPLFAYVEILKLDFQNSKIPISRFRDEKANVKSSS